MANEVRFRDTLLAIVPKWLKAGVGGALLYAFGVVFDLIADGVAEAVKRRFPGYEAYDSLNIIGKDRRIRRGAFETEANFAARLPQWLVDHSNRGGPYALLRQVFGFYSSNPFDVELRYHSGRKFDMDTLGTITLGDTVWVPPLDTDWATWFLIYQWPGAVNDDGNWDDPGTWDDGGIWDSDITAEERDEIVQVPSEWKAAHARGFVILQNAGNEAVMEVP
jgi:hypothetical protein